jgi:hypothetical protein
MEGADAPNDPYKLYLPATFFCGVLFIELTQAHAVTDKALSALLAGIDLRGFIGGVVLRGEGHTLPHAGSLFLVRSDKAIEGLGPKTSLLEMGMTRSTKLAGGIHVGAMLQWSESAFAQFAFDLIARLQGTYRSGFLSSFYGMGSTWKEITG